MPGALSAIGILLADTVRDYSRTVMLAGDAIGNLAAQFDDLQRQANNEFIAEGLQGNAARSVDLRYLRQGYELNVPYDEETIATFHRLHQKRYGFCDESKPIEIVNLRLRMTAPGEPYSPPYHEPVPGDGSMARYAERPVHFDGRFMPTPHYTRQKLVPGDSFPGPALITEYTSATALPPGWRMRVDGYSNLVLENQK
jgi:N-methylhydantoinase A